jgi:hypothetical protein
MRMYSECTDSFIQPHKTFGENALFTHVVYAPCNQEKHVTITLTYKCTNRTTSFYGQI